MRVEHPPRWRRLLKDAVASAIWRAHAHPLSAALTARGPRPLVIGYHRVVEDLAAAAQTDMPTMLTSRCIVTPFGAGRLESENRIIKV